MRFFFPACWLFVLITGCMSSPKPIYYGLTVPPVPAATTGSNIRVMVGPVALPDVLDQPRLVVHVSGNEVKLHEYHRWAGSLKNDIGRVVGAKLALDLDISNVWVFSQSTQSHFDYQVLIDVQSLESRQDDSVLLDMLWTIRSKDPQKEPVMGRSKIREKINGDSFDAIVAAQSKAFASASADIAQAIRQAGSSIAAR